MDTPGNYQNVSKRFLTDHHPLSARGHTENSFGASAPPSGQLLDVFEQTAAGKECNKHTFKIGDWP